jgi:hypothetical protein
VNLLDHHWVLPIEIRLLLAEQTQVIFFCRSIVGPRAAYNERSRMRKCSVYLKGKVNLPPKIDAQLLGGCLFPRSSKIGFLHIYQSLLLLSRDDRDS